MKSVTQDMKYRQSLMEHAKKWGVTRASRKYNRQRSYIYFWLKRYDGSLSSPACHLRTPHSHPNAHTPVEIKLLEDMRGRNPELGMIELWYRMRQRGYARCPESLYRTMRKHGMFPVQKPKLRYIPKPYQQMTHPGERIQADVKVVPRRYIADPELRLFQYAAIDEYSGIRCLGAFEEQNTYFSTCFLLNLVAFFSRQGIKAECVQTDNGFKFTNRFSQSKHDRQTLFEVTAGAPGIRHKLIRPHMPRHNGKVKRSHREDVKRFCNTHSFFSLAGFGVRLAGHQSRSNNIPMRPLRWYSPRQTLLRYSVQYV